MGSFEVIANIALVAFALKLKRDGEKEQFLALTFMPRYLYSFTFSTTFWLILNRNCLQFDPLLKVRHFVFLILTSSFHFSQYEDSPSRLFCKSSGDVAIMIKSSAYIKALSLLTPSNVIGESFAIASKISLIY